MLFLGSVCKKGKKKYCCMYIQHIIIQVLNKSCQKKLFVVNWILKKRKERVIISFNRGCHFFIMGGFDNEMQSNYQKKDSSGIINNDGYYCRWNVVHSKQPLHFFGSVAFVAACVREFTYMFFMKIDYFCIVCIKWTTSRDDSESYWINVVNLWR